MRLLLITFLTSLIAFLGTPLAVADHPGAPLSDPVTERYTQEAYSFFKQPRGCSHAVLGLPPGGNYDRAGVAWAEQPGCSIWISAPAFPDTSDRSSLAQYCGLIRHEVGHNLGLGHSPGPNVMNPDLWVHPNCYPPYHVLHRHRHVHKKRVHWHRHYHLKVGQP